MQNVDGLNCCLRDKSISIKLPSFAKCLFYLTGTMHDGKYLNILAAFYKPVNDSVILVNDLSESITFKLRNYAPAARGICSSFEVALIRDFMKRAAYVFESLAI